MSVIRQQHVVWLLSTYGAYFGMVYLLNFVWESWHAAYLFEQHVGPYLGNVTTFGDFVQLITYVSAMDAGMLLAVTLLCAGWWRDIAWWRNLGIQHLGFFVALAVVCAVIVEYKGVVLFHQWQYSELMPTIGGLGVSPLLQLAITGTGALLVIRLVDRGLTVACR